MRLPSNYRQREGLILTAYISQNQLNWKFSPPSEISPPLELHPVETQGIREAVERVQNRIAFLSKRVSPRDKYPSSAIEKAKRELEEAGSELTDILFGDGSDIVRVLLQTGRITAIDFHEPALDCNFPIEFCFFEKDEAPFYLGDKCVVVRQPAVKAGGLQSEQLQKLLSNFLPERTGKRKVGYAEDQTLGSACENHAKPGREHVEEIYALGHIIDLKEVDFLDEMTSSDIDRSERFSRWLSRPRDVLHFNSHTEDKKDESVRSKRARSIFVRHDVSFTRGDFKLASSDSTMEGDTIVFLNACGSAYGALEFKDSIAAQLVHLRAGAIACTVGVVNDHVGVEFAREFYKELQVPGTKVFAAMLAARRTVNARQKHPLANLYTIAGNDNLMLRSA